MAKADTSGDVGWRRVQVAKLFATGMGQAAIARRLRLAEHLVREDIVAIKNDWSRRRFQHVDEVMGQTLEKLDHLDAAMLARLLKPDGFGIDVRAGAVLVKSIERRSRLLGMDAQSTVDITPLLQGLAVAAGVSMELMQAAAQEIVRRKKQLDGGWRELGSGVEPDEQQPE